MTDSKLAEDFFKMMREAATSTSTSTSKSATPSIEIVPIKIDMKILILGQIEYLLTLRPDARITKALGNLKSMLLRLCGDVEMNPGPGPKLIFSICTLMHALLALCGDVELNPGFGRVAARRNLTKKRVVKTVARAVKAAVGKVTKKTRPKRPKMRRTTIARRPRKTIALAAPSAIIASHDYVHREKFSFNVAEIDTSAGAYNKPPGWPMAFDVRDANHFPKLAMMASMYMRFKVLRLHMVYRPSCPFTTEGRMTMGFIDDPEDPAITDPLALRKLEERAGFYVGHVYSDAPIVVPCRVAKKLYYTRQSTRDVKRYEQPGYFVVATYASTSVICGSLWIEGEVEFQDYNWSGATPSFVNLWSGHGNGAQASSISAPTGIATVNPVLYPTMRNQAAAYKASWVGTSHYGGSDTAELRKFHFKSPGLYLCMASVKIYFWYLHNLTSGEKYVSLNWNWYNSPDGATNKQYTYGQVKMASNGTIFFNGPSAGDTNYITARLCAFMIIDVRQIGSMYPDIGFAFLSADAGAGFNGQFSIVRDPISTELNHVLITPLPGANTVTWLDMDPTTDTKETTWDDGMTTPDTPQPWSLCTEPGDTTDEDEPPIRPSTTTTTTTTTPCKVRKMKPP